MAVTINGTTGFAGVTGTASAPAVQGTSANSGIYFGGNTINMATSGSQALTIDSSGRVLTQTTIPGSLGNAYQYAYQGFAAVGNTSASPFMQWYHSGASTDTKTWRLGCSDSSGALSLQTVNDAYTSATNRMIVDSSGNFIINGSAAYARLTIIQDPTTGPHISTSTAYSITNGSYLTLSSVTGMVLVSNDNNGDTGFYLVGGRAAVYLNSTKGTWVTSTTSPAAGKTSVAYDSVSDKYRIYNNFGSTQNFYITYISNRNVI